MSTCPAPPCHVWAATGRVDYHAPLDQKASPVEFFRCIHCRQDGFRRFGSKVVYTWRKEDADGKPTYPPPPTPVPA